MVTLSPIVAIAVNNIFTMGDLDANFACLGAPLFLGWRIIITCFLRVGILIHYLLQYFYGFIWRTVVDEDVF
jgi:hypothetical protein